MSSQGSPKQRLFSRYIQDLPVGELTWIGLRQAHKADMLAVESVQTVAELGLQGDHRMDKSPGSGRLKIKDRVSNRAIITVSN